MLAMEAMLPAALTHLPAFVTIDAVFNLSAAGSLLRGNRERGSRWRLSRSSEITCLEFLLRRRGIIDYMYDCNRGTCEHPMANIGTLCRFLAYPHFDHPFTDLCSYKKTCAHSFPAAVPSPWPSMWPAVATSKTKLAESDPTAPHRLTRPSTSPSRVQQRLARRPGNTRD